MIDAAFAIALILSLLKIAEMALRPHQKKGLQSFLEDATLKLDVAYPNYSTWIAKLPQLSDLWVFLFGGVGVLVSGYLVITLASTAGVLAATASTFAFGYVVASAGVWRHAPLILETWGWGPKSISIGALPSVLAGLAAAVAVALALRYLGVIWLLLLIFRKNLRPLYFPIAAFPGIALTGALAYPAFWVFKPVIRLLIALLWRVVEYQGGAWMAILFIATAALGLVKVFTS
jgi:hypothetical protein